MSHPKDEIARYFRGELSVARERDALFVHLRGCELCRADFDAQSAALRALSGGRYSAVELGAMQPALLDATIAPARSRLSSWAPWGGLLLAAAASVLLFLRPGPPDELTPKGGPHEAKLVHAICFDEAREVRARRTDDGACPAPGFVKVVFVGAETPAFLTVVLRAGGELRAHAVVARPERGTLVPELARLAPGEALDVIAIGGPEEVPLDVAKAARPVLTVRGEP